MSDLRDSGTIEQDADIIGFLHRPSADKECRNQIRLSIEKNRNGPCFYSDLLFQPQSMKFVNMVAGTPEREACPF